ncbi:methyl-accepting chemotaxis protein [Propionivibrio soli]|uniref:methyl-accepting chemotaxis protein n=1 Tax=Propionivibrio soli TaxID=2976531 RepID=UPI0021E89B11|nr:methyl-accepting chemotaxis protein [Propionivibrio soli]
MAFDLKMPAFLSRKKKGAGENTASAQTILEGVPQAPKKKIKLRLAFLEKYPIVKQLQMLGAALLVVMAGVAGVVFRDNQVSSYNTAYLATAGEMQMLSQRLAKAASFAVQGDQWALIQLLDSHSKFSSDLDRLTNGGALLVDLTVPPSPENVQPQLQALGKVWETTNKNTTQLLSRQKGLVLLGMRAFTISSYNAPLLDLSEQVAALKLQTSSGAREIAAASQLVMLTQRIAKNASELRVNNDIDPEIAFQLGKDTHTFNELVSGLSKGSEALRLSPTTDPETRKKLGELEEAFKDYQSAIGDILANMQDLVIAKQAGTQIFRNSEALLDATDSLGKAYETNLTNRALYRVALTVLVVLALAILALMAKIYLDDTRHQAEVSEESRRATEAVNRQNQDAILRLMNELGDLADGDLTVTATVSEDITGAIADSINYTVEELRVLVGRINDAAGRVTSATEIAQQTSAELLDAARRQSEEIQDVGHSVLTMASSMARVSNDADQSAEVARQSLTAAGKGTQAVQDSIKGMNEIREQIQETSKRIKRLGESSQEIGEIVELISDITEQTNVLALNAAIQAASAGEAGRGFTVVAEEVQRLAERSGEATKQIAAIVKTIQTDTQGAVSAMEESTRGVVEGAKLSDAAGQALSEIGDVSRNLAELIENISDATRQQADSATGVAGKMQDILRVTELTTAGTQKTASAVGELANLATELKGSVAGFKVS